MNALDGQVAAVLRFVEENGGGEILPHGLPVPPGKDPENYRWLPRTTISERCAYRVQLLGELGYSAQAQITAVLSVLVFLGKVTLEQIEQQLGAEVKADFETLRPPNAFDLAAVQEWLSQQPSEEQCAVELLVRADLFGWYGSVFQAYTFAGLFNVPVVFPQAAKDNWPQRRAEWNQSLALLDAQTIERAEKDPTPGFAELVVLYQDVREHFSEQASFYWVSLLGAEEADSARNAHRLHLTLSALEELEDPRRVEMPLRFQAAMCWLKEHAGVDCDGWRGISALPHEGQRLDLMIAPVEEVLESIVRKLAA